jgi:Zn-dependent protease/predicted transcriptional regulator
MFRKAYRLPFTLLGIPVFLDVSFLIILPIFAWSIARQVEFWAVRMGVEDHPSLHHAWVPYALGLTTAIGLFVSVLIHELGHSIIARLYGVQVRRITLWLLGGMAEFDDMPRQRGAEAVIAIAGPITSVLVAAVCFAVWLVTPADWVPVRFVFQSLLSMNVVLAVFNLIPALPLDGGRVLRSLLALKVSHLRATQIAAGVSKVLAVALGLYGLFGGDFMLVLVAFFVYMAVNAEVRNSMVVELLDGVRVADLMTPHVTTVPAHLTVGELAQTMVREHQHGFPVVDGNQVVGMVSLDDLQGANVPPETRVDQVMRPQVYMIRPDAPALDALQRMSRNKSSRLLVVDPAGRMVGTITNTDLMRAIEVRTMGLGWGVPDGNGTPDRVVVQPEPSIGGRG